jgi:hypothetical protein
MQERISSIINFCTSFTIGGKKTNKPQDKKAG